MKKSIYIILINLTLSLCAMSQNRDVVFSEIFYDTPENESNTITPHHHGEFIKLYNTSNSAKNISGWNIGIPFRYANFVFPANTIIPSKGVVVICHRHNTDFSFESMFPNWVTDNMHQLFYHDKFPLPNSGVPLWLMDAKNVKVDVMVYVTNGLLASNGEGSPISNCYSLHRSKVYTNDLTGAYSLIEFTSSKVNPTNNNNIEYSPFVTFNKESTFYTNVVFEGVSNNKNYITKIEFKNKHSDGNVTATSQNAMIATQYYDGLGRKTQLVRRSAASSGDDLVDYTEYNNRGAVSKQWLPVIGNGNGVFTPLSDVSTNSGNFYGDSYAYSQNFYDSTVANRVIESKAPGEVWHNAQGVTAEYQLNSTSGDLQCINFEIDPATGSLKKNGVYPAGELFVTNTIDEDGGTIYKFVNKNDSTILVRQMCDDMLDTYYIYDIYGNLKYALSPMASAELSNRPNGVISSSDEALQKYAYSYTYDYRNRCISKKLPGVESIYMVYDKSDQLIYSQDGNQRAKSEWTYFVYDKLGRLAYSGTVTDTRSHSVMCNTYKNNSLRTEYLGTSPMYGYTNIISYAQKANVKLVNYYDSYSFLDIYPTMKQDLSYVASNVFDAKYVGPDPAQSEKGMLTGSMCRLLDSTGKELVKAVYYDDKGNVVQSRESNHLGGFEKKYYQYSFTGKLLKYRHENSTTAPQNVSSNEEYAYTYDNWDRLLKTTHIYNGRPEVILSQNSYNDLGQLMNTGINSNTMGIGYTYNIRGWLKSINSSKFRQNIYYNENPNIGDDYFNGNISSMTWWHANENFERKYSFVYDGASRLTEAMYTEIGRTDYPGPVKLTNTPDYSTTYSYDLNSNITNLTRNGITDKARRNFKEEWTCSTIDDLTYTLNGNQLKKIDDAEEDPVYTGVFNFNNRADNDAEYSYDANGNMTRDDNKNITSIEYNYLNLPKCITYSNGHVAEYVYDAAGTKRSVIYKVQPESVFAPIEGSDISPATAEPLVVQSRRDYCDNRTYRDNVLERILTDNGFITGNDYHYYIKDYQGNMRSEVYGQFNTINEWRNYYPYGGLFQEEYVGENTQPYKFGGKELDRMNGLDLYDFGARMLDSATPTWGSFDPLAEKYYSISPYSYCIGNPIRYVDPNGASTYVVMGANGEYRVVGGNDDNDNNIYAYTFSGNTMTSTVIGVTATSTSFYNSDKGEWRGYIKTNDKSGLNFMNDIATNTPSLVDYMYNARTKKRYDFKATNGGDNTTNKVDEYRGMPIGKDKAGHIVYASARDIGNMAAGYIAGVNGFSWFASRLAFDAYQSYSSEGFVSEGRSTQNAEYLGWKIGNSMPYYYKRFERERSKITAFPSLIYNLIKDRMK